MENHHQHTRKRPPSGKVFNHVFQEEKLERLKSIIRDRSFQGKKKRYCILIDGEIVVPTNSDHRNFDNYKKFLLGHTQSIEVRMFFGSSPNCNRHIFQTGTSSLNGITPEDVEKRIQAALEKQKVEHELEFLRKEVKRKDKKIERYRELEAELEKKQIDIKSLIKEGLELYSQFTHSKKTPTSQVQGPPLESEVEVQVTSQSPIDKQYQELKEKYSEKEMEKALKTWELFSSHPELHEEFSQVILSKKQ